MITLQQEAHAQILERHIGSALSHVIIIFAFSQSLESLLLSFLLSVRASSHWAPLKSEPILRHPRIRARRYDRSLEEQQTEEERHYWRQCLGEIQYQKGFLFFLAMDLECYYLRLGLQYRQSPIK